MRLERAARGRLDEKLRAMAAGTACHRGGRGSEQADAALPSVRGYGLGGMQEAECLGARGRVRAQEREVGERRPSGRAALLERERGEAVVAPR
jgi:hypothetical protein